MPSLNRFSLIWQNDKGRRAIIGKGALPSKEAKPLPNSPTAVDIAKPTGYDNLAALDFAVEWGGTDNHPHRHGATVTAPAGEYLYEVDVDVHPGSYDAETDSWMASVTITSMGRNKQARPAQRRVVVPLTPVDEPVRRGTKSPRSGSRPKRKHRPKGSKPPVKPKAGRNMKARTNRSGGTRSRKAR